MSKETIVVEPKEKKPEVKAEKKTKAQEEKAPKWTIAKVFRDLAPKGHKSKDALADAIIDFLGKKGITENIKQNPIKKENVLSQVNSICRDIGTADKAGAKTRGWWTEHVVVETDTSFKIVNKAQK